MRISRNVIVAGYALDKALTRVRALRKDGAESLLAMSVALLYLADVRTGFVGKPRQGGGPWQRYTLRDLAQLAYGAQTGAELERAKRSIDMMVSLGWAFPTKQVRRHTKDAEGRDGWCSEPGVRRLNFQRLCDMAGTSWLLKRDRKHADQARGTGVASFAQAHARRQSPQDAGTTPRTGAARPAGAPSHGRPARRRAECRAAHLRHPRPVQIAVAGRLAPARCRKNRRTRRQICREKASRPDFGGLDHHPAALNYTPRTEFHPASGDKPVGK